MTHKRADQITVSAEWAKHLRPHGKRAFWKAERRAYGEHAAEEASSVRVASSPSLTPTTADEPPPGLADIQQKTR